MTRSITISDFKCFLNQPFSLGSLTVLAGQNSSGKSTVIQSLLLSRAAYLNYSRQSNNIVGAKVHLNGPFSLELGNTLEVVRRGKKIEDSFFSFSVKGDSGNGLFVKFFADRTTTNCYHVEINDLQHSGHINLTDSKFYYLSAERIGPRLHHTFEPQNFPHAGYRGERTFQLLSGENLPVDRNRCFDEQEPAETLFYQTRKWLEFVIPGANFDNASLVGKSRVIEGTFGQSMPPNVGFGISYALPIIVNSLTAQKGGMMLIENPEAHLHPKGQSNMGFFLGKIAAAGVQIVVETHSEHLINGIRKAVLSISGFSNNDVNIYFFKGENNKSVTPIEINSSGDLIPFPVDFFDQARQDLFEILKLSNR